MKILQGQKKAYKDWYDKNSNEYGRACFAYAERWAELMEAGIENSDDPMEYIFDNAERLSKAADVEGITGNMYRHAVNILLYCWEYGELFRIWNNNECGYNPAILGMSVPPDFDE